MAVNAHTTNQKPEDPTNLSEPVERAIRDIDLAFPKQKIEALNWNENYIAIPLEVNVDLPTRGPVGGIDIWDHEPIFLLLHRRNYPYKAPSAYSNRQDFPAAQLPHLNPTIPGTATHFCLHRGNPNNWFAEHTIVDLVKRVQAWLRDAAGDRLIRREDGFEETRLPFLTPGYAIYEPSEVRDHISQFWQRENGVAGYALIWYELFNNTRKEPLISTDTYAIQLNNILEIDAVADHLKVRENINRIHREIGLDPVRLKPMLVGVLIWPARDRICKQYFGYLPEDLKSFQEWGEDLGILLADALDMYLSKDFQLFGGVPVTLVVPRPQRMIRTESNMELLNFVINAGGDHRLKDTTWSLDAPVWSMGHRAPLTLRRAREISSQPAQVDLGPFLFLGCGAIGSKMILHLARSGQASMTLVDYDELSPHNLIRHALLHESLGMYKAEGTKKAIEGIFYADKESLEIEVIKRSAEDVLLGNKNMLNKFSWLIDVTSSPMILNLLSDIVLPKTLSCSRCEIADSGRLGFMSIEGYDRNPRLDDIQASMFDLAIDNPNLSQWLQTNQIVREEQVGSILEDIYIGISCSSETMRLSDELVSLHASAFATGFRNYSKQDPKNRTGKLLVSHYGKENDLLFGVQSVDIPPVTQLAARNNSSWEIRLNHGLYQEMRNLLRDASPNETGGLLIGLMNLKRKIIYVTRILPAPPDSKGSPYAFKRGIQDIPEQVLGIQDKTGGMLGYVGEWHTHPTGGSRLSPIDLDAVHSIRRNLDRIPLPTHVMVVTTRGVYSYVFSPD